MLEIDSLTKRYKGASGNALERVSFSVPAGSFAALLGPNGAGKSTLIGILSGMVRPDSGEVAVDGISLSRGNLRARSGIGIVPQEIAFDYVFTAEELLSLEFGFHGLRRDAGRVRYLLDRLSLAEKSRVPVRALSGGMKRRLMIAKALVHRPRLLLLDEPTAGVDPRLRTDLQSFLKEISDDGTTIVLTTHQLEDAEILCDRILVLDRGRLIADETRRGFLALTGDYLTAAVETRMPELLTKALPEGHGYSFEKDGRGVRVSFPRERREPFLRALADASAHVDSFQINPPSLEDVFRKITGGKEQSLARA